MLLQTLAPAIFALTCMSNRFSVPPVFRSMSFDQRQASKQAALIAGVMSLGGFLALSSLRLPVICPLRRMTGVPCPLCGMTTGTVEFMKGDLWAAANANPLSIPFVPAMGLLFVQRVKRMFIPTNPRLLAPWQVTIIAIISAAALIGAWIFELHRFEIF